MTYIIFRKDSNAPIRPYQAFAYPLYSDPGIPLPLTSFLRCDSHLLSLLGVYDSQQNCSLSLMRHDEMGVF